VPLLLLTLVAFPLLVSSCFTLGYDATYEVGRGPFRNILGTTIANDVISGLAWVLPVAGLIAISIQPEVSEADSDLEHGAMQQGQFAPSHAPPAYPEGIIPDKEHPRAQGNRFSEWKDRMADWRPSFRKGGKSSLGLRTAF